MLLKKVVMIIFSFLMVKTCDIFAEEFIYPVALIDEKNILIVHQQSLDEIGLFLWNIETKVAKKELSSMFLPSFIKVLPSKQGFSFIDRGRIRIKMFHKRTPKTVEIVEPIGSIVSMHWINDNQFYCVAQHLQKYKVFLYDVSKNEQKLYFLTDLDEVDYIYPFKIEDTLFCIFKNNDQIYSVSSQDWRPTSYELTRDLSIKETIFTSPEPLCFLHMKSKQEGYFLKCNLFDTPQDADCLSFSCYRCIKKEQEPWCVCRLFTFKLPKNNITGISAQRAYESIYPFLPNYDHEKHIYFINYDEELKQCMAFFHNKDLDVVMPTVQKRFLGDYIGLLSPIILSDAVCYGVIVSAKKAFRTIFNLNQETGMVDIDLPMTF